MHGGYDSRAEIEGLFGQQIANKEEGRRPEHNTGNYPFHNIQILHLHLSSVFNFHLIFNIVCISSQEREKRGRGREREREREREK
jgi:hypothetical protein